MAEPDRPHLRIPRTQRLALALEARVDIRTLEAVLRGEAVRGDAGERAKEVLSAHGHLQQAQTANT